MLPSLGSVQVMSIRAFIDLTEQIANSKTNILDFGSEDMTFYRGEIHMIKMIGDFPGIYSAELARKFGITRPVVHKTLQKLSDRGLIMREDGRKGQKALPTIFNRKRMVRIPLSSKIPRKR